MKDSYKSNFGVKGTDQKLGSKIMNYLYSVNNKNKAKTDKKSERRGFNYTERLFDSKYKSDSGKLLFGAEHPELFDNVKLLHKDASVNKKAFMHTPIAKMHDNIRKYTGNPLTVSGLSALGLGGAYWLLDKYTNPDDDVAMQNEAIAAWKANKGAVPYPELYKQVKDKYASERWKRTGIASLLSFLGSEALFYRPGNISSLWKFQPKRLPGEPAPNYDQKPEKPKKTQNIVQNNSQAKNQYKTASAINKKANMFGTNLEAIPTDMAYNAIASSDKLNWMQKSTALNMISSMDSPYITPQNVVNSAVSTGSSAKVGVPLGRMAVASIADGLTAMGVGKLLGVTKPGRLGMLTGASSALVRSLF